MFPAIVTRYHGPSSRKGSRLSSRIKGAIGTELSYAPWNFELSTVENHRVAAKQMLLMLGIASDPDDIWLIGGTLGDDYIWLIDPNSPGV